MMSSLHRSKAPRRYVITSSVSFLQNPLIYSRRPDDGQTGGREGVEQCGQVRTSFDVISVPQNAVNLASPCTQRRIANVRYKR